MNSKDLYFAVADIDEKWIEESETKSKKNNSIKFIIPVAACFAVAAAVAVFYNNGGNTPIQPQSNTEHTNGNYAVSEDSKEQNTFTSSTDIPKTDPYAVSGGKKLTDEGNGFFIAAADSRKSFPMLNRIDSEKLLHRFLC